MLNKENTKKAEAIRDYLAPLFARASKLADTWQLMAKAQRLARDRAYFWQYAGAQGGNPYGETLTEQEKEEARQLRATNPKEWHNKLYNIYNELTHAENTERAHWFNFSNYCRYIGQEIAEQLRPMVWEFIDRQGLKTFAEIITPTTPNDYKAHTLRALVSVEFIYSDSICLIITVYGGGACGAWFSDWFYFRKDKQEPQKLTPPQTMTGKQYAERLAKIRAYEGKAKAIQKEQRQKAKEWGMLDACELLESPRVAKYRK